MHVIGTAGHVDHGKSSLVLALTGIDPDRLAEEKAREMTIDLGFAWLGLPGGETAGIVDVPGHRDFIDNMLAGISGIDLALLVIAADEGMMPQTREHLAIIDLLEIPRGVIALTKIDIMTEPGWLELVRAEISASTAGTVLENARIIPVSARTGSGLDSLVDALGAALASCPPRPDRGRPRLPIDRVFSMKGFGTVVTGTLDGGVLSVGDEVEIVPRGAFARVRGLQSHGQALESALPGSRTAINLSGIDVEEIQRGDVVALPGLLRATGLIDVRFRQHRASSRALRHNDTVLFFSGAAETQAQVRLLGSQETTPGDEAFLQLRLGTPLALDKGDRFILRWPSPADTVGGGVILDAHPAHRWRRFKADVLARFETLANGTPEDIVLELLQMRAAAQIAELAASSGLALHEINGMLGRLADNGTAIDAGDGSWMARTRWERVLMDMEREIGGYHAEYPLKGGMPREALRSRLGTEVHAFNQIVVMAGKNGVLVEDGALVRLAEHRVVFSEEQERAIEALNALVGSNPTATPSFKEAEALVGSDVMDALVEMGKLVRVGPDVWFDEKTYQRLTNEVREYIAGHGAITIAGARDMFNTSRKYATALLEHLDEIGVTMRSGDAHVLKSRPLRSDQQPDGDQKHEGTDHQADEYGEGQDDDHDR